MLKARKKITHKELKQDKLVTAYFESKDWFGNPDNKRKVTIAAGIVVLLIAAFFFYTSNRKTKNEEAETRLSAVISIYDAAKFQESINGDSTGNVMGLAKIVNEYGSTESGQTAKLYLGNCYFNIGDFDNAMKQYEDYSGKNDIIKASCLSGIGAVYDAKGDNKKAAEYFEKAANVNKDVVINQENIFYAMRAYSRAGDKENARKMLTILKEQYPKSKYINESKRFESDFKN